MPILVPQRLQHGFEGLFLREKFCGDFSVFVPVYQYMLRRWNQAVLNSAIPCYGFLIGARVKKSYVQGTISAMTYFWKKHLF